MSKGKKIALIAVIVPAVMVLGLAIIIPIVVNVDRYRPQVAAQIQKATGKPTQIGRLDLSIFPQVAIRVDDFSLGNPEGFPSGDFVKAKSIKAVVNGMALLHHRVEIKSLDLSDLSINMLEDTQGRWNFENSPPKAPAPAASLGSDGSSFTLGVISKLTVSGGQVSAADVLPSGLPSPALMAVHGASIDLHDVNLSAISASSQLSPGSVSGLFARFVASLNPVVHAAEPAGPMVGEGTLDADALEFAELSVTKMKSHIRLYPKQVFADGLKMKLYNGSGTGNLSLDFGGANLAYSVDMKLNGVNVAELLNAVPQAKGMLSGTMDATAKLSGAVLKSPDPLAGISGSGKVSIRNGRLPSLQLDGNLRELVKMAGIGPANGDPSSFTSLSADYHIADARLVSDKITLVGDGVDVEGSGSLTTAGSGSLDFQGNASLAASEKNPLGMVLGGLAGAKTDNGKLIVPFTVGGTFAQPRFSVKGTPGNPAEAGKAVAQQPLNTVKDISGLFKK